MHIKILLLLIFFLFQYSYGAVDYEQLQTDRNYCYKVMTSNCFAGLINKYSMANKPWKNILRFDYAQALMSEKNYVQAKENFKTVLLHESNNEQLIKLSKENISKINELFRKMAAANNVDAGNYYKKDKIKAVWQRPYNIKVYIASNTKKEHILKRAFNIWDEKMFKTIGFSYVDNIDDADIVIEYVDKLSGNVAGITHYTQTYTFGNKNYLKRVDVKISKTNPSGGMYTDNNLLGTALHEIGHALGITYHSENLNDIMYYSTDSYKNINISHCDINTLKQIYRN